MLQRENLAAVAQRTLRQQANLGQAVDHHALRLEPFDRLEDALDGLAEFEIGRIEQALMLIGIEHAFRRHQLEDLDTLVNSQPCERRAVAQFLLGFGEADVDAGSRRPRRRSIRNCIAMVVLPVPGLPSSRKSRPRRKPPAVTSSNPATPVRALELADAAKIIPRPERDQGERTRCFVFFANG